MLVWSADAHGGTGGGGGEPGSTAFQLYAEPGGDVALAGEIDLAGRETFAAALDHTSALQHGADLVIDGNGLEFIDHRGLLAITERARHSGVTVTLRTGLSTGAAQLVEILDLNNLRVEVTG